MDEQERYQEALTETQASLHSVAQSPPIRELSRLSLPQIDKLVEMVARMTPAGNAPGVILSGLSRLPGRRLAPDRARHDANLLFAGVEKAMDTAVYGAFFAGPAAVLWAYQNLVRLAGKNPSDAFPEGTWQFYIDYALREDTARHTAETHGFDTLLNQYGVFLNPIDRMTAWVMTAVYALHQYDHLLRNEWRERVYLHTLREITQHEPDGSRFTRLYRHWEQKRPYRRNQDAGPRETYPQYREAKFNRFLEGSLKGVRPPLRQEWVRRVRYARETELGDYQDQMSILAYLDPGPYGERRTPLKLSEAHVGVIYNGQYYLLPICRPDTDTPVRVETVRSQIAAIVGNTAVHPPAELSDLAAIRRPDWQALRPQLSQSLQDDMALLRTAPILFNFDKRPLDRPLAKLRQAERGVGDHAVTIFDTGGTFIFDMSHIFFDGTWSVSLAEILTNLAISWATYLHILPKPEANDQGVIRLSGQLTEADHALLSAVPRVAIEAGAETNQVDLKSIMSLRRLFKQRSETLRLTVNDILVLYRAIHALTYRPDPKLVTDLDAMKQQPETAVAAETALAAIHDRTNPAILIPVDASQYSPRDRVHPMTLTVPVEAVDLINLHQRTYDSLQKKTDNGGAPDNFDVLQPYYLAVLAGLGELFARSKQIAAAGESTSVGTIKLLAHLPISVQRTLDKIPHRFDILNDIIKGREVFSNVGAVVPGSTLSRFMTAKDDNERKTLAWAVISDAEKVMRITLRDFRPHVELLAQAGQRDMADRITVDYLNAYAAGLNRFVQELLQITLAGQGTRLPLEKGHA